MEKERCGMTESEMASGTGSGWAIPFSLIIMMIIVIDGKKIKQNIYANYYYIGLFTIYYFLKFYV